MQPHSRSNKIDVKKQPLYQAANNIIYVGETNELDKATTIEMILVSEKKNY